MEHNGDKTLPRTSTDMTEATVDDVRFPHGSIFWLPPKTKLLEHAVKRAHGKGAIEDGIYGHPVVVVSRPAEESSVVHFHLVSLDLLKGKDVDN
jgi:hypothetical protein